MPFDSRRETGHPRALLTRFSVVGPGFDRVLVLELLGLEPGILRRWREMGRVTIALVMPARFTVLLHAGVRHDISAGQGLRSTEGRRTLAVPYFLIVLVDRAALVTYTGLGFESLELIHSHRAMAADRLRDPCVIVAGRR